ncbi:MAG TPA: hypothetical protein VK483_05300 [Chitinophagaceae bacterium]|nr:hypothetical protein [Chitinophagaceae bacterium]
MKAKPYLILLLCLFYYRIAAQTKNNPDKYKDGYALNGKDTIWCKVLFDSKHDDARKSVRLLIKEEETNFFAGGTITGFGIEEDGKHYDYGTVDVEVSVADRRMANLLFVKKLAAGTIDLYEYSYSIFKTKRTTINGVEQPGATTTSQNYTNNYISKTDSTNPILATPVLLPSFRKKDLEPYLSDNVELFASAEKRFSIKELIAIIKEYNKWSLENKKP